MAVPVSQMYTVTKYVLTQKLRGVKRSARRPEVSVVTHIHIYQNRRTGWLFQSPRCIQ